MLRIYYGKGKGKTSAALGSIMRAAGYGKKITLVQFFKPRKILCGEYKSLKKLSCVRQIRFKVQHPFFTKKKSPQDLKKLKSSLKDCTDSLKSIIKENDFDILVCDELLNLLGVQCIQEKILCELIAPLKNKKEIILTGRDKPKQLMRIADYATECKLIKHPFEKGAKARRAIEY